MFFCLLCKRIFKKDKLTLRIVQGPSSRVNNLRAPGVVGWAYTVLLESKLYEDYHYSNHDNTKNS